MTDSNYKKETDEGDQIKFAVLTARGYVDSNLGFGNFNDTLSIVFCHPEDQKMFRIEVPRYNGYKELKTDFINKIENVRIGDYSYYSTTPRENSDENRVDIKFCLTSKRAFKKFLEKHKVYRVNISSTSVRAFYFNLKDELLSEGN